MWNLSKKAEKKFQKSHLFPIYESDEEWEMAIREAEEEGEDLSGRLKDELEEVKEELLQFVPKRFHPYIENGTLNQPTLSETIRNDYLQWIHEESTEFEHLLDAANENSQRAMPFLPTSVQKVFSESLHDAVIDRIDRNGNTLHLYINTDGGFTTKSYIHFIFQHITGEESDQPLQIGQWLIYYELQKTTAGFAFRVLLDCPDAEWTVSMKSLDAEYYYRPALYTTLRDEEKLAETSLADYLSQLNPDRNYWLITPHIICRVKALSEDLILENGDIHFTRNEMVVTVDKERYTYDLKEYHPTKLIYTDVYEDPYARFSEPVPTEEIEDAVLGDDLELQVRAWNTLYASPEELSDVINRILPKITISEENEMLVSVFVSHFHEKGVLSKANMEKYQSLLD